MRSLTRKQGIFTSYINLGPRTLRVGDISLTASADLYRDIRRQRTYFVDTNDGNDSSNGKSWGEAFLTMSKAFNTVASGGCIAFTGNVKEQLDTPLKIYDVLVTGTGNRPRHADTHPTGSNLSNSTWRLPAVPSQTTPLVRVQHPGWEFENILFAGPTSSCCIKLNRTTDTVAEDEKDASHAVIRNCRFAGSLDGIHIVECADVLIQNCQFQDLTGYAVKGVAGDGVANPLRGKFLDNTIIGCANGFYVSCNQWLIQNNMFDDGGTPNATTVCDVMGAGANGANNFVVGNYFQTTTANFNTPDIVGSTTDVWVNYSFNTAAAGTSGVYEVGQPA